MYQQIATYTNTTAQQRQKKAKLTKDPLNSHRTLLVLVMMVEAMVALLGPFGLVTCRPRAVWPDGLKKKIRPNLWKNSPKVNKILPKKSPTWANFFGLGRILFQENSPNKSATFWAIFWCEIVDLKPAIFWHFAALYAIIFAHTSSKVHCRSAY